MGLDISVKYNIKKSNLNFKLVQILAMKTILAILGPSNVIVKNLLNIFNIFVFKFYLIFLGWKLAIATS